MNPNSPKATLYKVPVYEVRLVQSRRPLRLAEVAIAESNSAARTMHAMLGLTDREHFAALFLNGQHQVTGAHVIAVGGQHGIGNIDNKTVFRAAISACASAILLGHNHPSGDPAPSPEDIVTTKHIMLAGKILCIPVVDHVIVTRNADRYHSMFERGTLPAIQE